MPKISIIVPIYNSEKYLKQCLDSILNQTMKDIEIICVDDGSTDSSLEILEEYKNNDERLKYISQKNQYAGVARNNGMKIATGDFLLFLDSDDFIDETLCEKVYHQATIKNADIVLFKGERYNQRTDEYLASPWYFRTDMLPLNDPFSRVDMQGRLLEMTFLGPWNKLFKKSFIQNHHIQFQPLHNSNDDYFVAIALSLANRITYVNESLIYHRIGLQNNLQSKKYQHPLCFMEAYEAIYDRLNQEKIYEEIKQGFISRLLTDCVYHLKTMTDSNAKWLICQNITAEHFSRMGILDNNNINENAQRYIKGLLNAYQWHQNTNCIDNQYQIRIQNTIEHPKISIIVYLSSNNIDYLLKQKLDDIEVIIITQNNELINQMKINNHITIIEQSHNHISYAQNIGLEISKGEYILFLDEHYPIIVNALESLYEYASYQQLDILYFYQYDQHEVMRGEDYFNDLASHELLIPHIQYQLINTHYIKKAGIHFLLDVYHDNYFLYRSLILASRVLCVSAHIYEALTLDDKNTYQNFYDYFISSYRMRQKDNLIERKDLVGIYSNNLIKKAKDIYFELPLEQQLMTESLEPLEYNYFKLCIDSPYQLYRKLQKTYKEKSLINQKLQKTYTEKSSINQKLQKTYNEKHERGIKIKELENEVLKLQDELETMKNSKEWKIGTFFMKPFKKG